MSSLVNSFWGASGAIVWDDIADSTDNGNSIGHNPPEVDPKGIWMKPDGTKMYTTADGNIYQWSLSTAFDITSATYDSITHAIAGFGNAGIWISEDGTKLYMASWNPDRIYRVDMSSGWDLSTASDHSNWTTANNPRDVKLSPDGTKIFVLYETNDNIIEYDLSTPFDLTTISAAINTFDYSSETTSAYRFFIKQDDGLKLFVLSVTASNYVYQYSGTTGFDLSTFAYDGDTVGRWGTTGVDTTPRGIYFKPDGTKWYMAGITNDNIYEIDLP